jgi:hypothetical protein
VRKDRELTFEIDVDADLDWAPEDPRVFWRGGTAVPAEIVAERTTAPGRVAAGLVARLGVRLTADGPAGAPERLGVRIGGRVLMIGLVRA